jgi:hypothetical protein
MDVMIPGSTIRVGAIRTRTDKIGQKRTSDHFGEVNDMVFAVGSIRWDQQNDIFLIKNAMQTQLI